MFVVILIDMEATYGPGVTDTFGPYETEKAAHDAAKEYFRIMDDRHDFSDVFSYEVKPVRTMETSANAHSSFIWMHQRADKFWRFDDNDRTWP